MLYVYAITGSEGRPQGAGLRGSALGTVREDALSAVVSEHEGLRVEATEDDLWTHERVVEKLMGRGAILPMRFGSVLAGEPEIRAALRARHEEFAALLTRVRDAVEIGVRAAIRNGASPVATPQGPERGPGTAYMLRRLERARRGADVAERIHRPLAMLARDSRHRLTEPTEPGPGAALMTGSYLVDRDRVDAFRARVGELEDDVAQAAIVCTGPWPPYSFTSGEEAA